MTQISIYLGTLSIPVTKPWEVTFVCHVESSSWGIMLSTSYGCRKDDKILVRSAEYWYDDSKWGKRL